MKQLGTMTFCSILTMITYFFKAFPLVAIAEGREALKAGRERLQHVPVQTPKESSPQLTRGRTCADAMPWEWGHTKLPKRPKSDS